MTADPFTVTADFGHPEAEVIDKGNGVHVKFPNGWTVSVQWGPGTYSSNYDRSFGPGWPDALPQLDALTAEIAAWKGDSGLIRWPDGDTVQGWQSWDDVQQVLTAAAADQLPLDDEEEALHLGEEALRLRLAVERMRAWAEAHGEADTQGLMDDEWEALARAALDLPQRGGAK